MVMKSIGEIKVAAAASEHYREFFAPETLRFWKSRVSSQVFPSRFAGTFFVTSERSDEARRYTVRVAVLRGPEFSIGTVGEFRGYRSLQGAVEAARRAARAGNVPESYPMSVCRCCLLVLANGECCDSEHGSQDYPQPLSAVPAADGVSPGMGYAEHADDCLFKIKGGDAPGSYECECENLGFRMSTCDGCGCSLGGDRFAATGWVNERA